MKICSLNMKEVNLIVSMLAGSALLVGCAGAHNHVALDTVGPVPSQTAGVTAGPGSLVVFSAHDVSSDINYEGTYSARYSSYKIFSAEGKLLKRVANNSGTFIEHPEAVALPAGKYNVVSEAEGCGAVTVPVVISGNRLTVVHLDGDKFWSQLLGLSDANTVHLPGGQFVGWRAESNTP